MRKICLLALLGVFVILFSGCDLVREPHLTIISSYSVTHHQFPTSPWIVDIGGTAINDGDYYLSYAEVVGAIYDDKDRILDQGIDMIWGLRKNEKWYFEIRCQSDHEPDHYEVWVGRIDK